MAGVFLVTLAGCGMATIFAVIEFLYGTRKAAMEAGVSWLEEMSTELKFIFTCHGNTKKVGQIELKYFLFIQTSIRSGSL